jgi:hypothetical protein
MKLHTIHVVQLYKQLSPLAGAPAATAASMVELLRYLRGNASCSDTAVRAHSFAYCFYCHE